MLSDQELRDVYNNTSGGGHLGGLRAVVDTVMQKVGQSQGHKAALFTPAEYLLHGISTQQLVGINAGINVGKQLFGICVGINVGKSQLPTKKYCNPEQGICTGVGTKAVKLSTGNYGGMPCMVCFKLAYNAYD